MLSSLAGWTIENQNTVSIRHNRQGAVVSWFFGILVNEVSVIALN